MDEEFNKLNLYEHTIRFQFDMINELQQAKDKLQNDYQEARDRIDELQQENKQLKERFENLVQEHIDTINRNEEKQQRIDKAIEYIKTHSEMTDLQICGIENVLAFRGSLEKLLEILGDKE